MLPEATYTTWSQLDSGADKKTTHTERHTHTQIYLSFTYIASDIFGSLSYSQTHCSLGSISKFSSFKYCILILLNELDML